MAAADRDRARLFVALLLPETVIDELLQWRAPVLIAMSGLRAVRAPALHVTLCFLGSCPGAELAQIADVCEVVAAMAPPALSLGAPMWLPIRRPKVLAIKLEDREDGLAEIRAVLAGSLTRGGWLQPEVRPFLAHVTVARAGRRERVRPVELEPPTPVAWPGGALVLFRSRLEGRGPQYEPLRTVQLGMSVGSRCPDSSIRESGH